MIFSPRRFETNNREKILKTAREAKIVPGKNIKITTKGKNTQEKKSLFPVKQTLKILLSAKIQPEKKSQNLTEKTLEFPRRFM